MSWLTARWLMSDPGGTPPKHGWIWHRARIRPCDRSGQTWPLGDVEWPDYPLKLPYSYICHEPISSLWLHTQHTPLKGCFLLWKICPPGEVADSICRTLSSDKEVSILRPQINHGFWRKKTKISLISVLNNSSLPCSEGCFSHHSMRSQQKAIRGLLDDQTHRNALSPKSFTIS